MKLLQYAKEDAEYIVFVEDNDDTPTDDYVRPGFDLVASVEITDELSGVVGIGDCYVIDR